MRRFEKRRERVENQALTTAPGDFILRFSGERMSSYVEKSRRMRSSPPGSFDSFFAPGKAIAFGTALGWGPEQ